MTIRTRSWAYPECPNCESDVFTDHNASNYATYICRFCGERWDEGETDG